MKVLITGANGFVGLHLTEALLAANHEVFALVRNPKSLELKHPNLHIITGQIDSDNYSWLHTLPKDLESCVHCAGIVHSFITDEFYRINSFATENLLSHLYQLNPSLHFILISSLAAAGPSIGEKPRTEEDMLFPISDYGRSKQKAEEFLKKSLIAKKTIIRPPMVIGPRDGAVIDIFKMVKSRVVVLPGLDSKKKLYSFVCVYDLVETIKKVIETKTEGTFFSAHSKIITFEELITKIKKLFGYKFIIYFPLPKIMAKIAAQALNFIYKFFPHNVRLTPDKFYELTAKNFTCNGQKSKEVLGQNYNFDIDKTLDVTFKDYKMRRWI